MKWHDWTLFILLLLTLPIALMSVLASPNEYAAQGIAAVDCDGPAGVMVFAVPAYLIYGIGMIVYARTFLKTKKAFSLLMVVFCISTVAAITPNVVDALAQQSNNSTIKECAG